MATKYAGQNALNKLMQLVKTALNNKADKTNATTSAAGLMSAADKVKLDGIEAGATKTTVDAALDAGSSNPVQNKAVKAALDEKLDNSGGTLTGDLTISGAWLNVESTGAGDGNISVDGVLVAGRGVSVLNGDKNVSLECAGDNAAKITSLGSDGKSRYSRFAVGTPTGDNDAATKAYVDSKVASGGVTVDTEMSSTSTNPVQNKTVKNYVDTKVSGLQTASQVQAAINKAIVGVYTPRGSIQFANLPQPQEGNKGYVYNVLDAFTTTAAFIEGAGHSYGSGTNVVCVDAGSGSYKWDVLAGIIDLTELTADEVQTLWDSI